jgi:hypothetical protein
MTPNNDQLLMMLRWVLSVGGPVGALLVSHGMSADQVTALTTWLLTGLTVIPPAVAFVWGLFAHTHAAAIATVNAMPKDQVLGVVVATTASDGVLAAAQNPAMSKVMMATPALTAAIAAAPVTIAIK